MNLNRFFPLLLAVSSLAACKKNVDFPPEIRPRDFWVRCTITDDNGQTRLFEHRGEDNATGVAGLTLSLMYFSDGGIQDSIKYITSGLNAWPLPTPFYLRLNHPERVTDPFTPKDWRAADLAEVLYPGKTWRFGNAPGEALLAIGDFPGGGWAFGTNLLANADGYVRVLEVSDYGIPELGTPYFGKKARVEFSADVANSAGTVWRLRNGEAVLFFRYFTF